MVARAVWLGTGMRTTTPVAASAELKPAARTFTVASMRERPTSRMTGITLNGRLTSSVTRYFISSNSPSGGTNDTVLSLAKRLRLTHWWKVTSSSSIDLPLRVQMRASGHRSACGSACRWTHLLASRPAGAPPPSEDGPSPPPPPSPPLSRSFSPSFSSGMPCAWQ
jgi:hypothetical protein